jgi:hypothetical protein
MRGDEISIGIKRIRLTNHLAALRHEQAGS